MKSNIKLDTTEKLYYSNGKIHFTFEFAKRLAKVTGLRSKKRRKILKRTKKTIINGLQKFLKENL